MILHGQPYRPHSPSFFEHGTKPIWLAWDGDAWRVAVRGSWGARLFATRDAAAALVGRLLQPAPGEPRP